MTEPRAYTADEIRDQLLEHIRQTAVYWAKLPDVDQATGKPLTVKDRCEGVAFSILAALDGTAMTLPAFDLMVMPHESDKSFHIENGENWIEPGTVISDMLHELFYPKKEG